MLAQWAVGCILLWVLSRCLRVCRVSSPSSLSGLSSQKGVSCWPWSLNRKRCHSTTLTRRCFLIQAQGELLQLKPNCLQSSAWLCAYVHACAGLSSFKQAHMRQCVALSPFKIADKCRSLCLASLCMCTQWLGLQAVVLDWPHWKCDKSIIYRAQLMLFTEHHRKSTIQSQQSLRNTTVTNACVTELAINP